MRRVRGAIVPRPGLERHTVRSTRPLVESPDSPAGAIVERALDDLLALRNWDIERPGKAGS